MEQGAPASGPLVGRDAEMDVLVRLLDDVAAGRPGVVVLEGEAGIGKTRLARETAETAAARGFQLLVGHLRPLRVFRGAVRGADGCGAALVADSGRRPGRRSGPRADARSWSGRRHRPTR